MFRVVTTADAPRESWLAARVTGIGASESPKVMGLAPRSHGEALSVYAAKVDPQPQ